MEHPEFFVKMDELVQLNKKVCKVVQGYAVYVLLVVPGLGWIGWACCAAGCTQSIAESIARQMPPATPTTAYPLSYALRHHNHLLYRSLTNPLLLLLLLLSTGDRDRQV